MLDGDEPEVKLDVKIPSEVQWNNQGDAKAITVTCDPVFVDDGPEPKVATDS
jgi:hypothetical protein